MSQFAASVFRLLLVMVSLNVCGALVKGERDRDIYDVIKGSDLEVPKTQSPVYYIGIYDQVPDNIPDNVTNLSASNESSHTSCLSHDVYTSNTHVHTYTCTHTHTHSLKLR